MICGRAWHLWAAWLLVCAGWLMPPAQAHEFKLDAVINAFVKVEPGELELVIRAPLYLFKSAKFPVAGTELDLDKAGPALERALAAIQQDITLYEDGRPLTATRASARLALPSDRSFENYGQALQHVAQPLEPGIGIVIDQGYVDARISYPTSAAGSEWSLRSRAGPELGDALKLAVRFMPPGQTERAMVITSRSGTVALNPGPWRAAATFAGLGLNHTISGFDHLLFLLCLVIPLRAWRPVLAVITAFTAAHSLTLLGSALGLAPSGAWFPLFVETTIAASIVFMAFDNILGAGFERRFLLTGQFGLVHGFGFSYGLQENFQFAGTHLLVSLLAFNVGIELGQLGVFALLLPALALLRRFLLPGRAGMIILSALVADTGWRWMLERGELWWKSPWPTPSLHDAAQLALWLALILFAAGGLSAVARRLGGERHPAAAVPRKADAD